MKVCPVMKYYYGCLESVCGIWVPEITEAYRCTLDIKNEDKCPITNVVGIPENIELFCDECEHYKKFKIKRIPGHCGLIQVPKNAV